MKNKFLLLILFMIVGCTNHQELGSKGNPFKIALTPGKDAQALLDSGSKMKDFLEQDLQIKAEITVPASYMAVVETIGSKRTDLAILNTMGYVIASERYQAQAIFTLTDRGRSSYKGQFIARKDGPKKIEDLNGKKIAYVDPISSSGFVLPSHLLKDKNIIPKETVFAGRHDSVVTMVYQKQVDAGATFWLPDEDNGKPYDARRLVETQFPDVFEKIKIIGFTQELPNEAMVLRKDLPEPLRQKVIVSLQKWIGTDEGKKALKSLYGCDGLKPATDADYDSARKIIKDASAAPSP